MGERQYLGVRQDLASHGSSELLASSALSDVRRSLRPVKLLARRVSQQIRFFGRRIIVDPTSFVSRRSVIRTLGGGSIMIGHDSSIHDYAMLLTYGGDIELGNHCTVNPFCILYGHGGLKIGNGVRIASHTVIIPADHIFDDTRSLIYQQELTMRGIVIGDDVWIGSGCRILDGVVIGKGSVIGAGSVVTEPLPEYAVAVGAPARVIRQRG